MVDIFLNVFYICSFNKMEKNLTKHERKSQNDRKTNANGHSASFVALVDLVRHMARCAAQYDYEAMLKAAKENEELIAEWKNKK